METNIAVLRFGALSQETRLNVLRELVKAGHQGVSAGGLAEATNVPPSTLSFHLKELQIAGLVKSVRNGRQIVYSADFEAITSLIRFLMKDCCQNEPAICSPILEEIDC